MQKAKLTVSRLKHIGGWQPRLLGLLLVAATACALADNDSGGVRPDALYQRNCAACHGEKGDGNSIARKALAKEPRDFTTDKARQALPREYMIAIVRDGEHEAPMVGRKSRLSQAEIEAIVDFIRAAFMPPAPGSPLARGREIYVATCAGCHGERGQGAPISQHNSLSLPLSLTRASATLTRQQVIAAIGRDEHAKRQGNTLAGVAAQLSASDIDAVADYVRSAFINAVYTGKAPSPAPAKAN